MTTTCQDIIARAQAFSPLNSSLTSDSVEMLTRIRAVQERAYVAAAKVSRTRFTTSEALVSTNAASNRTLDLTTLTQPLMRLLKLSLAAGTEILQVPEIDQSAQLSPRYFVRGTTAYEVSDDWSANTGTVSVTILYAYGPATISVTGSAAAINVSVPDEFTDVIILPLAMYLHQKDTGRDPAEYDQLEGAYREGWQAFMDYLTNYGGDVSRRAIIPAPPEVRAG